MCDYIKLYHTFNCKSKLINTVSGYMEPYIYSSNSIINKILQHYFKKNERARERNKLIYF